MPPNPCDFPMKPNRAMNQASSRNSPMDEPPFDRTDYSVVVKHRAPAPNSWKWEIYRAGRLSPIRQSTSYFPTMVAAIREGKEALKQLLEKIPA